MDCQRTQELIPLMLNDLLSGDQSVDVREHLENCPECREVMGLESRITDTLDNMFHDLPAPAVSLPSRKDRSMFQLSRVRAGLAAAAVVVLALILSQVLKEDRIHLQPVSVQSPVRDVAVMRAEYRVPTVRQAGDMAVTVDQLKDNIVWVSIQN